MPFIDCKLSKKITEEKKERVKEELGKAVSLLRKSEAYLMVGFNTDYDLYFGGRKLENGAYVSISLFGDVPHDCSRMTKAVCDILKNELSISPDEVYITYRGVKDWGFNGDNF